jgi:hypothetical protein
MAFYNTTQENEEKKDSAQGMNQADQNQQTQPVQLSNQSASVGGSTPQPKVPTTPKPAASGTGPAFQNYAKANQGKAQESLNSAAAQNVANQGKTATSAINQATTQFGQRVDQGSLANRQNALQDVQNTINSARNLTAGNAVDQSQQDRFKEVINNQYTGPESLRQAGLYNKAATTTDTAQTAINNTKTATGREELLKQMYQKRGDYTAGLNKLDSALLNSSQQGVQNLQNTAAQQGNIGQTLDKAQINSANLAQNRTQELLDIKNKAREAFTQGKTAEEAATEERLKSVVDNWEQLPEYYREIIRKSAKGPVNFNTLEAASLGINSGEGLYNLGADAIKSGIADKQRLISKNEQARQAALASLAGLDQANQLSTNLLYNNADLAGTQTALDALDLEATRAGLNAAEKNFQDFASKSNITGTGMKKNKTSGKKYFANSSANLKNTLKKAGYEFGQEDKDIVANQDVLKALSQIASRESAQDGSAITGAAESMGQGLETGGSTPGRDVLDAYGSFSGLNAVTGALGLGTLSDASLKGLNTALNSGPIPGLNEGLDSIGLGGIAPTNKSILDSMTLGQGSKAISGITNSVFGGGANSRASKSKAKQLADQDLQRKTKAALNSQGFNNRANVVNNEQTTSRLDALQQLLANLDKTNIG